MLLELLQALGKGGLRQTEHVRSCANAAAVIDLDEVHQVSG